MSREPQARDAFRRIPSPVVRSTGRAVRDTGALDVLDGAEEMEEVDAMGRNDEMRAGRRVIATALLLAGVFFFWAGSAAAVAQFDPLFGFLPEDLEDLPSITMDASDPWLMAGEETLSNLDVELTGTTDLCVLAGTTNTCLATPTGVTDPYMVLVTFTVSAINTPTIDGDFTLFLSGLMPNGSWGPGEVEVVLDQAAAAAVNPTGFVAGDFRPFVHVIDESGAGDPFHYVGWTVQVGDTISFKYNVVADPAGRAAPHITTNALARPIPEPGTALLMGLGLAGLTLAGSQRGERRARRASADCGGDPTAG